MFLSVFFLFSFTLTIIWFVVLWSWHCTKLFLPNTKGIRLKRKLVAVCLDSWMTSTSLTALSRSQQRSPNANKLGRILETGANCSSMVGNRHKATAQRMPSGRKQDWGDQPLFDQSDLYVIPEALFYEFFGGILSSTPSSNE